MKYNDILNKIFFSNRLNRKNYIKFINNLEIYPNITNYLKSLYNYQSSNIKELIYRLHDNDFNIHQCKECGKPINYFSKSNFCSSICRRKSQVKLTKANLLNKYGVDNVAKLNEVKEKMKQTCLERYGVTYSLQSEQVKNKSKETITKKYGVDNVAKSSIIKEKINNTKLNRYGYINNFCNKEILNKAINNSISNESIQKRKTTLIKKYGVDNFAKTTEFYSSIDWKEREIKSYQTKKKNNSFHISKTEDISYILLKEKYSDIIRQYKSDVYPFACDFYIPSLDLYIECNYHWTHGEKLYEGTTEDNKKLEYWKSKNTRYYNNAINIWTTVDVKKYNIAKEYHLNYIIFYNIKELQNWLNKKEEDN